MRKYSYLVIGAGGVGPAIAWWLAKQNDTRLIAIADRESYRAMDAASRIMRTIPECMVMCPTIDISDEILDLPKLFEPFSAVISAIPASFSFRLASAALDARVPFIDLGGVLREAERIKADLHERAYGEGIEINIGNGLMPGGGTIIAQHRMNVRGWIPDSILIEVCGLAQHGEPPTYHQRTFSVVGMLEIMDKAPILRNGKIDWVQPMETIREMTIPALKRFRNGFQGKVQTCITAGADTAAWWFKKQGVKNFWEETPRWSWDAIRDIITAIPPDERVAKLEQLLPPTDLEHPDLVWMRVTLKKDSREDVTELIDTYDPHLGFSAMARTTGFSTAIVARLMAQGPVQPGVHGPEEMLPERLNQYMNTMEESFSISSRLV